MKSKKGKKLVVLGAMAALLTLIGVSGSQTYAKYVEKESVNGNSATVARWGYVINVSNVNKLFGDAHENLAKSSVATYGGSAVVVESDTAGQNVVAPGTKGYFNFEITGSAEVDALISFNFTGVREISMGNDASAPTYYPLKWTLTHNSTKVVEGKNLADVSSWLSTQDWYIDASSPEVTHSFELSYEWIFYADENTDKLDTILGELEQAGGQGQSKEVDGVTYTLDDNTVAFNFAISVEQKQGA